MGFAGPELQLNELTAATRMVQEQVRVFTGQRWSKPVSTLTAMSVTRPLRLAH